MTEGIKALRECPFCGGTARIPFDDGRVSCSDFPACAMSHLTLNVQTWNRRASRPSQGVGEWEKRLWSFAHEIKERKDYDLNEFQDWLTEELKTLMPVRMGREELARKLHGMYEHIDLHTKWDDLRPQLKKHYLDDADAILGEVRK